MWGALTLLGPILIMRDFSNRTEPNLTYKMHKSRRKILPIMI